MTSSTNRQGQAQHDLFTSTVSLKTNRCERQQEWPCQSRAAAQNVIQATTGGATPSVDSDLLDRHYAEPEAISMTRSIGACAAVDGS